MANTEIVLHGVGKGMAVYQDGSVVPFANAQDISIEISTTEEDVYGGDGLFPILSFVKEKGGTVKITNATTTVDHLKLTQSATVDAETAKAFKFSDVKTPTSGTCTLSVTTGVDVDSVTCVDTVTGKALTRVTGSVVKTGEFSVTAVGVVTVDSALEDKLDFSYFYTSAKAVTATVPTNGLPGTIEYRHHLVTEDVDGKKYNVYFRIYKAKCSGKFTFDLKRGSASAPALEFKLLDPKRDDNAFMDYTIEEVA